jgi:periplasmic copper chaperone A
VPHKNGARAAVVGLTAAGVLALAAAPAFAHVTVNPSSTAGGGYSQLTFRAPNEEATARFTKLTIHLPADHPVGYVGTRAIDGWTVTTTKAKLPKPLTTDDGTVTEYTDTVTWTATGSGIPPEQYQNFDVSLGALPDGGTMTFAADQYYSDGSVVKWDQTAASGAPEPEHPAPVLTLTAAQGDDGGEGSTATMTTTSGDSNGTALGLSIAALVIAVVGTGAGLALARRRTS